MILWYRVVILFELASAGCKEIFWSVIVIPMITFITEIQRSSRISAHRFAALKYVQITDSGSRFFSSFQPRKLRPTKHHAAFCIRAAIFRFIASALRYMACSRLVCILGLENYSRKIHGLFNVNPERAIWCEINCEIIYVVCTSSKSQMISQMKRSVLLLEDLY